MLDVNLGQMEKHIHNTSFKSHRSESMIREGGSLEDAHSLHTCIEVRTKHEKDDQSLERASESSKEVDFSTAISK